VSSHSARVADDSSHSSRTPSTSQAPRTPVIVRSATLSDIDALVRLEDRAFDSDRLSRRSFRHFVTDPRSALLLAEREGRAVGYALVLFRTGTGVARLYSLAVEPDLAGTGIGSALMAAGETEAFERDVMLLRLEVRADNERAIALYEQRGYKPFGRYLDYYEDHADAVRLQKRLTGTPRANPRPAPYYAQTTEFTCGPACLMMAMGTLTPGLTLDTSLELRLWREATTIFMTAGHGGCEPVGLAVALARRGYRASVHVSEPGPYFLDGVRNPDKRKVMALVQREFAADAAALGVPIAPALTTEELAAAVEGGAVAVSLVSHYRMLGDKAPHWIVIHDRAGRHLFAHDPWVEPDALETPAAVTHLPIPLGEFERMARFGQRRLRATILVRGGPQKGSAGHQATGQGMLGQGVTGR